MAVIQANIKTLLTSASIGSHQGGAQNNPDDSLGGWASTTEESTVDGNLWELFGLDQLNASVTYRCVAILNVNPTDVLNTCRILGEFIDDLDGNISLEMGLQTNDFSTIAPISVDEETPPPGITFFNPFEDTGVPLTDWASAKTIGPLNSPQTGTTDLTLDDATVIFIYFKITLASVTADFNGSNNILRANVVGSQA